MTALIILTCVFVFLVALVIGGAYFSFKLAFYSDRKKVLDPYSNIDRYPKYTEKRRELIANILSLPCEEIRIKSKDGLTLFARYFHVRDGAPLEIQFHGYRSMAVRDFSASGVECFLEGYNLLLVDQRSHGQSEGKVISFGINERLDCLSWIDYAIERFGKEQKIILYGISMGAATVLMAAGEKLPNNVICAIVDCPYSSQLEMILRVSRKNFKIPRFISRIIAPLGARIFGGFSLTETTPKEAVTRADLPILLIHGESDDFVPPSMSEEIREANPNIKLVTFAEAEHGFSYLADTERYRIVVREFIKEAEGKKENI